MGPGDLVGQVRGEIELDGKVLVIRRIHVHYELRVDAAHCDVVERVHEVHATGCPVARTLSGCVAVTTDVQLVPSGGAESQTQRP